MTTSFKEMPNLKENIKWDQLSQLPDVEHIRALSKWWNTVPDDKKPEEFSLIEQHINAITNENTNLLLGWASFFGMKERVSELLKKENIDVNYADSEGVTALAVACANNCKAVVVLLLADPRIDVNKANIRGVTPIWVAAAYGYAEIVTFLLSDSRVNVTKASNNGLTPAMAASHRGYFELMHAINENGRTAATLQPIIPPQVVQVQTDGLPLAVAQSKPTKCPPPPHPNYTSAHKVQKTQAEQDAGSQIRQGH